MKNCLVTKLNAIVPDPDKSMEYFNGFIIERYFTSAGEVGSIQFLPAIGKTVDLTLIDGDADFVVSGSDPTPLSPSNKKTTTRNAPYADIKSKVAGYVRILVQPSDFSIETIEGVSRANLDNVQKYDKDLSAFIGASTTIHNEFYGSLSQETCERLTNGRFHATLGSLEINLAYFANNTSLIDLTMANSGIKGIGLIESLGKAILMKNLNIYDNKTVGGSIQALAEAQVANGRNNDWPGTDSNTLTITVGNGTQVTVDGTTHATAYQYIITFNSELPNGYSITTA